ncbi:MAG: PQQ-dependent sugar dehydrogenase [Sphingobacteriaceae bacterium]
MKNSILKNIVKIKYLPVITCGILILAVCCSSYITRGKTDQNKVVLPTITLKVQKIIGDFGALTDMVFPGNGEMWVTEQDGKIWAIKDGQRSPVPIMDLGSKIVKLHNGYEERGLLGITLHPDFKTNKKFYVFYSRPAESKSFNHTAVVAEYKLSQQGQIDPQSGKIILTLDEPDGNHNGGCLKFGPDGYLYISFGDGGGQHDQHGEIGNGQNLNTLLGKILRIDINTDEPYKIPADNPFVAKPNVKPEIWAYGFRNPYRFSFDKVSKQLFAGEVGQDLWEEIDIVKKAGNYGWKIVEGTHCHNNNNTPDNNCDVKGIIMPIDEYSHSVGVSVMGGYVYNGNKIPMLKSKYIFADWTGPVFYLQNAGAKWSRGRITLQSFPDNAKITGINEDLDGELYLLTNPDTGPGNNKCAIYKIIQN